MNDKYGYQSIDPAAEDNSAIRAAAGEGHIEVVAYLLGKKEENPELYGRISLDPCR